MRNRKIHGQPIFDVEKKNISHGIKTREKGRRSTTKKVSPKGKRKLSFQVNKLGLLSGKNFFLDIQGSSKTDAIKQTIVHLGGTVEEFNSKDVYCIVTNRVSFDEVVTYRNQSKRSTPSPLPGAVLSPQCAPTPSPLQQLSSNKGRVNSPLSTDSPQTQQSLDQKGITVTRGKSLLSKAVSSTQKQGSSNLLQLAQKWGTKVLHLEHFLKWTKEKKVAECLQAQVTKRSPAKSSTHHSKNSTFKVKKLKNPFIKVESQTRKYRPFFLELDEWPVICFESTPSTCPFEKPRDADKSMEGGNQISDKETNKIQPSQHISDKSSEKDPEKKEKEPEKEPENKRGVKNERENLRCSYCECCSVRFNDLSKHLKSDQHRSFARNDSNYADLDFVIRSGTTFEKFLESIQQKYEDRPATDDTLRCTTFSECDVTAGNSSLHVSSHVDCCNEKQLDANEVNVSEKENQPLQRDTKHFEALEYDKKLTKIIYSADAINADRQISSNAKESCHECGHIASQTVECNGGKYRCLRIEHLSQIEGKLPISSMIDMDGDTETLRSNAVNEDPTGTAGCACLTGEELLVDVKVHGKVKQLASERSVNKETCEKKQSRKSEDNTIVDDGFVSRQKDAMIKRDRGDVEETIIGNWRSQGFSLNREDSTVASSKNVMRTLRRSSRKRNWGGSLVRDKKH